MKNDIKTAIDHYHSPTGVFMTLETALAILSGEIPATSTQRQRAKLRAFAFNYGANVEGKSS